MPINCPDGVFLYARVAPTRCGFHHTRTDQHPRPPSPPSQAQRMRPLPCPCAGTGAELACACTRRLAGSAIPQRRRAGAAASTRLLWTTAR